MRANDSKALKRLNDYKETKANLEKLVSEEFGVTYEDLKLNDYDENDKLLYISEIIKGFEEDGTDTYFKRAEKDSKKAERTGTKNGGSNRTRKNEENPGDGRSAEEKQKPELTRYRFDSQNGRVTEMDAQGNERVLREAGQTRTSAKEEANREHAYLDEMDVQREQAAYDDEMAERTRATETTEDIDPNEAAYLGVTGENLYDEAEAQSRYLDEMDAQREQAAYDDEMAERTRATETTDYVDEGYWEALEREMGEAIKYG